MLFLTAKHVIKSYNSWVLIQNPNGTETETLGARSKHQANIYLKNCKSVLYWNSLDRS